MSILKEFRVMCEHYPEKIAIIDSSQTCTYWELDQKSNILAQIILNKIGPQKPILLFLEPSIDQIIVLLAVLKARCYYIPCDIRLAEERLEFMVQNSEAALIISDQPSVFSAEFACPVETLHIKTVDFELTDKASVLIQPKHHDLAYVIYTSGTTGLPKGVKISHGNLNALFTATKEVFSFSQQDVWAYVHSYGFDFSVWEIWGALTTGATLILFSYATLSSPELFVHALLMHRVSVLNQTPSAFYRIKDILLGKIDAQKHHDLRYIIFGGEKLEPPHIQSWIDFSQKHPALTLVNMYGITEGTVHCTFSLVHATHAVHGAKSMIGKPLAGFKFHLHPIEGQDYELLIAGPSVCQGYLKCPDLEKEKFITLDHTLYFKTGDLVRPIGDQLEYIGRIDDQVKIRGYRVTLGEINYHLGREPNVQSVVTIPIAHAEDTQLISFVTLVEQAQGALGQHNQTQVSHWENIYEQLYAHDFKQTDHTFNIQGWNSSLTNQPLSRAAMQEWHQDTLEKIDALKPRSVLEIGCGSGLILFGLIDKVDTYCGIDLSQQAISQLQSLIPQSHVSLYVKEALHFDTISELQNRKFDCIILNSVIQYFPSLGYLRVLIRKMKSFLNPNGSLFFGDIRNYNLLEEYHYFVAQHRNQNACLTPEQIQAQTYTGVLQEKELLISPDFFLYEVPQLLDMDAVNPILYRKRNTLENELNLFRYDAIVKCGTSDLEHKMLHYINDSQSLSQKITQLNFDTNVLVLSCLDRTLHQLTTELKTSNANKIPTASYVITTLPEIQKLGSQYPLQMQCLLDHRESTHFVVLFYRGSYPNIKSGGTSGTQIQYAHHPLEIEQELFAYLRKKIPFYAIPNHIHVIDALPTTNHGKIDKLRLINFHKQKSHLQSFMPQIYESHDAETTHLETILMTIWKKVLKLKTVGLDDDFFAIGGDSISSLQTIHCCKQVGLQLNIRDLFECRTIRNLLLVIEKTSHTHTRSSLPTADFNLSFIQDWFLQCHTGHIHEYCQSFILELQPQVDTAIWIDVLTTLFENRSSFKLRFKKLETQWVQFFSQYSAVMIHPDFIPISAQSCIVKHIEMSKKEINIENGYGACVHFFIEDTTRFCAISIHHLLIDAISWKHLIDDLCVMYTNKTQYKQRLLHPESMHYEDYVNALDQIPISHILGDLTYWLSQLGPNFFANKTTQYAHTRHLVQCFPLGHAPLHTTDAMAMQIAALYLALYALKKQEIVLTLEKHGREDFIHPHIESSIGWHTSIFPFKLHFSEQLSHQQLIEEIKQLFLAIPHGGITFLAAKRHRLLPLASDTSTSDISFNFLGNYDHTFADSDILKQLKPCIESFNQIDLTCPFTLQVNTIIQNNHLFAHFIYDQTIQEDMLTITRQFQQHLEKSIILNQHAYPYRLTPMQYYLQQFADFPFQFHQLALTVNAAITRAHLEQALLDILQQHEIFKMRFQDKKQYLCTDKKTLRVQEHWVTYLGSKTLHDILLQDLQQPFHLNTEYLVRLNIIHTEHKEQTIILSYHQYVLDGWALQQFLSLWSAHIVALEQTLPTPSYIPSQDLYLQYVHELEAADSSIPETHPHHSPHDAISALAILKKRYGSYQNKHHNYGKYIEVLNANILASLQTFCSAHKITMGTFLITAFGYFLADNHNQSIRFKTIEAGRLHSQFDYTLGALTQVRPILIDPSHAIQQAAREVSRQLLLWQEAFATTDYAADLQQEELILSFQNFRKNEDISKQFAHREILQFSSLERTNTPMTIRFVPSDHLEIWVSYQESCFTEVNVKKMCAEFVTELMKNAVLKERDLYF